LKGFRTIFRDGYKYKKAGVTVSGITASDAVQASIFDFDEEKRLKHDRISKVMDAFNSSDSLLRLGTQRPGHYADGIRSDFRSRLYTTNLDDVIEVR
jgi:DNA polymerase V